MGWGGGGGPCDSSVSPSPFGLDFGTLDIGTSDLGLTICGNVDGMNQHIYSLHFADAVLSCISF